MVRQASMNKLGRFTKQDIRELCPSLSVSAVEGALRKMVEDGDEKAKLVYEAMALNVAKGIGRLAPVCCGKVDRIILTGGIAYSKYFTGMISERLDWIAPVTGLPGENEMQSLAEGALRVLRGEETARSYPDGD